MAATSTTTLTPERVRLHKQTRFNALRSLTPQTLSGHLDAFARGTLRGMAQVMEEIEQRDDIVRTVSLKRKKDVARLPWDILTVDTGEDAALKARAAEHQAALKWFFDHLTVTNALDEDEQGGVRLLVRQMMDAVGKRYAVHEVVWKPQARPRANANVANAAAEPDAKGEGKGDGKSLPTDFPHLSAELRFVPLWFFESETGRLRFLAEDYATAGVEMKDSGWLRTVGDGIMVACSIAYMFKSLPMSDWLTYSERHGMPGIRGVTNAAQGSPEWREMAEAVANFAADFAAVMNHDQAIEVIDLKGSGALPYPPLIERMDRIMSSLWRGADLSTMSAGTGQGQGASVQAGETELLQQDDAEWISETINLQLTRHAIRLLFGKDETPLAYFKIVPPKPQNVAEDLKVDDQLVKWGVQLGVADTLERYGRSAAAPGEETLQAAPAGAPGDPGAPGQGKPPATPTTGKNGKKPEPAKASNAESTDPAFDPLYDVALGQLARAQAQQLEPVRREVEALVNLPEDEWDEALVNLRARLPELYSQMDHSLVADVLERTYGAALLTGLTGGDGEDGYVADQSDSEENV
ncbi:hypothetical protein DB346_08525 [Verrucomicrobia bacterium LW23]|nr:hypothetical protein DB346_08525 [Verrucomicrobia bacterium LW23]